MIIQLPKYLPIYLGLILCVCFYVMLVYYSPPTFKTLTPLSRTQLKQQLMRDQALQEQERRQLQERAQKALEQRPAAATAMRVPLHSIAVDVPPQVLQVSS